MDMTQTPDDLSDPEEGPDQDSVFDDPGETLDSG